MPYFKIVLLSLFLLAFSSSAAISADPAKGQIKQSAQPAKSKEMSKDDLVTQIEGTINRLQDVLNYVPGLKKVTDNAGKVTYLYQDKKLQDLSKEQLIRLNSRINSEAVRIRTDRLTRQLESISRANKMANQRAPAAPPSVYVPPRAPSAPPSQPKVPPQPQTTRR